MKTKSFQKYVETRLNKEEIAEIRHQAQLEVKILKSLQHKDVFRNKKWQAITPFSNTLYIENLIY